MDIQVASNFERLLLELEGSDGGRTRARMPSFAQAGEFALEGEFPDSSCGGSADQAEVAATIAATLRSTGELVDPHTAVGLAVASAIDHLQACPWSRWRRPAAKFPEAVEAATGVSRRCRRATPT